MPLITCPTCGHNVSDQAASCPQCGHPIRNVLAVQAKMKSKPAAALLAIFVPFLGAFYGSPAGALVCLLIGAFAAYMVNITTPDIATFWYMTAFISYIISIFVAVLGANRYNQRLANPQS